MMLPLPGVLVLPRFAKATLMPAVPVPVMVPELVIEPPMVAHFSLIPTFV